MSLLKAKKIEIGTAPDTPAVLEINGDDRLVSNDEVLLTDEIIAENGFVDNNLAVYRTDANPNFTYYNSYFVGRTTDNSTSTPRYIILCLIGTTRNSVTGTFVGARESSGHAASAHLVVNSTQGNTSGNRSCTFFSSHAQVNVRLVTLTTGGGDYMAIEYTPTSTFRSFDSVFFTGLVFNQQSQSLKYLESSDVSSVTSYDGGTVAGSINVTNKFEVTGTLILPVV